MYMNKYTRFPTLIKVYTKFLRSEPRSAESQGERSNHYATAESGLCAEIVTVHYWTDVVFQIFFFRC
jgi:hypothetical protein